MGRFSTCCLLVIFLTGFNPTVGWDTSCSTSSPPDDSGETTCFPVAAGVQGLDADATLAPNANLTNDPYLNVHVTMYDHQYAGPRKSIVAATVLHGMGSDNVDDTLATASKYVGIAKSQYGADIVVFPEEFAYDFSKQNVEAVGGPITQACQKMGKDNSLYVVCPLREMDPDKGNALYNTAVLVDRLGNVVGKYRKNFLAYSTNFSGHSDSGLVPGDTGVPVFDTDFGRIAIFICADAPYVEIWHQAGALGVDMVLFPSAFPGGEIMSAYAFLYSYYIVANGNGDFFDLDGTYMKYTDHDDTSLLHVCTLDLDRAVVCPDGDVMDRILHDYDQKIVVDRDYSATSGRAILKSVDPNVSVRQVISDYGWSDVREEFNYGRRLMNTLRMQGKPCH